MTRKCMFDYWLFIHFLFAAWKRSVVVAAAGAAPPAGVRGPPCPPWPPLPPHRRTRVTLVSTATAHGATIAHRTADRWRRSVRRRRGRFVLWRCWERERERPEDKFSPLFCFCFRLLGVYVASKWCNKTDTYQVYWNVAYPVSWHSLEEYKT